jgi:hypothetical protein
MSGTGIYQIEAQSYSILGIASHDFWVLRNPDGSAVANGGECRVTAQKACPELRRRGAPNPTYSVFAADRSHISVRNAYPYMARPKTGWLSTCA